METYRNIQVLYDEDWGLINALDIISLERSGSLKDVLCFGTGQGKFLMFKRDRQIVSSSFF